MIGLEHYTAISSILFAIGLGGLVVNRHNYILLLICLEIMLLAVDLGLASYGVYRNDPRAHIFVLVIFAVAAAETALGIALGIAFFRHQAQLDLEDIVEKPSLLYQRQQRKG